VLASDADDRKIYVRSRGASGSWGSWIDFGGTTDEPLAAAEFDGAYHFIGKGLTDRKLYIRTTDSIPGTKKWNGGATSVPVAAAVFGGDLHLFAKGLGDDRIYSLIVGRRNHWSTWFPLPPVSSTTDAAVSVAYFDGTLHLFAKGIEDRKSEQRHRPARARLFQGQKPPFGVAAGGRRCAGVGQHLIRIERWHARCCFPAAR
jgi:hypothetical protein